MKAKDFKYNEHIEPRAEWVFDDGMYQPRKQGQTIIKDIMYKIMTSILLIIILISCNNNNLISTKMQINVDSLSNTIVTNIVDRKNADTAGFFSNCQKWNNGVSMGYLQGIDATKDSLGVFCFYECYSCKQTFKIIFVHKDFVKRSKGDRDDSIWNEFQSSCGNDFANFNCFAFIFPMYDPDKQKDIHSINIKFPVYINAYERTFKNNWKFIKKIKIKTFKELGMFQFKTIYHFN